MKFNFKLIISIIQSLFFLRITIYINEKSNKGFYLYGYHLVIFNSIDEYIMFFEEFCKSKDKIVKKIGIKILKNLHDSL
jgi:hypothetical protein